MSLFPMVLAAHLLGDWLIQSDHQAANKAASWRAMHAHMLGYHATLTAALALTDVTLVYGAVIVAVSWATHSVIDRRWPVRWILAHTGSAAFAETTWGVLVADQALHLAILSVLVAGAPS